MLAPWPEMMGGFKSHPLTYDEAFERAKASFSKFRWNYAVVVGICTIVVLIPHPKLILAAALVVYVAAVLYTDKAPAPAFVRASVPPAHRPALVGCIAGLAILCTDLVGFLIVGAAVGASVCLAHAVYVEPPVTFV